MGAELKLRREAVEWREADDEVLVLDVGAGEYLATNATGARLWQALAEGSDREQLVAMLVESFDVDESAAASDVDGFLATVRDRGLLEG
jgi:hypothetical protein